MMNSLLKTGFMLSFINGTDDMFRLFGKKDTDYENLKELIPFDPENQYAVIKSSICTGEKVAGFKNKKDGHFTEVMLIRSSDEEQRFKDIYGIDELKTEY